MGLYYASKYRDIPANVVKDNRITLGFLPDNGWWWLSYFAPARTPLAVLKGHTPVHSAYEALQTAQIANQKDGIKRLVDGQLRPVLVLGDATVAKFGDRSYVRSEERYRYKNKVINEIQARWVILYRAYLQFLETAHCRALRGHLRALEATGDVWVYPPKDIDTWAARDTCYTNYGMANPGLMLVEALRELDGR